MAETKEFKAKETKTKEVKDSKMKKFREGAKVVGKEVLKETLIIGGGAALVYAATIVACKITGMDVIVVDRKSLKRICSESLNEAAKTTEKVVESVVS